jgi:hypothetical protein
MQSVKKKPSFLAIEPMFRMAPGASIFSGMRPSMPSMFSIDLAMLVNEAKIKTFGGWNSSTQKMKN